MLKFYNFYLFIFLYSSCSFSSDPVNSYKKVLDSNEQLSSLPVSTVENKIRNKFDFFKTKVNNNQFGVTSIDQPFMHKDKEFKKIDYVYKTISEIGVDNVKSGAADWSRIATPGGGFGNLENLRFQLDEAKKYNLSSNFIIGYPPIGFGNYSKSIRTSVNNKYINNYKEYLNFIVSYLKPYNVTFLELGNEVDAGSHWWIHGTPAQYVNEAKILHGVIEKLKSPIKVVVFSATYSRNSLSAAHEGRSFIKESFDLGIDNYADAYSLHHFTFPKDDGLVSFAHSQLSSRSIKKELLDTEQMDTTKTPGFVSPPYNIIKMFASGFFDYNLSHIDYFMARDAFVEPKVYPSGFTQGLFDVNWNPKPRLLALAMSIDAMKGRHLVSKGSNNTVKYYILKDEKNISKYKYALLLWNHTASNTRLTLGAGQVAETWDLTLIPQNGHVNISEKPLVIFSDDLSGLKKQVSDAL